MFALYVLIGYVSFSLAYENLALYKPSDQQYQYPDSVQIPAHLTDASNAVDGLKSNLGIWGGQCVISAINQRKATWRVNLGSILSIHHITIYYRTGNRAWGPSNGFTPRFLGFSLYISNTTRKSDGTLCFHDTNFTVDTIPAVFNTTCPVLGQYVIYYNERLAGVTYPDNYSENAFNELCEVEVYGCPSPGLYGPNCSIPCPDPNCHHCNSENGRCQGCKLGYEGHQCEIACEDGKFGLGCNESCGQCLDPNNCSKEDGTCLNGCAPGYNGSLCKTPCRRGTYGTECHKMCGHCFGEQNCFHINGTCLNGCGPGYYGDLCKTVCDHGYFGPECKGKCGQCLDNNTCNRLDGICPNGCQSGYQGNFCKTACDQGYYGIECKRECGHCLGNNTCNYSDGVCPNGCGSGYQGDLCQTVCPNKTYGLGCSESCGYCRNRKACHNENGTCLFGCDPGFIGDLCKTSCEDNHFGLQCKEKCNSTCKGCTKTTGLCENGCQSGWSGSYCHIAISDQPEEQDSTHSITGAVVGSFVALLIIIIVVRTVRKKRVQELKQIQDNDSCQERDQDIFFEIVNSNSDASTNTSVENEDSQELNLIQNELISFDNQSSKANQVCSQDRAESDIDEALQQIIPVDKLESAMNEKRIKGNYGFKKEYAALPSGEIHTCDVGKMPENIPKNRFRTSFPYDHSRVILNLTDTEQSDYINANYIDGVNRQREYIATQGPKPNTIVDFWRMVWQQNVFVIVMLTNLKEGNKLKCSQYWPNKNLTRKYGSVLVKLIQEKEYAFFTERKFSAKNTELGESREVTQYHYIAWPDHGTPEPMNLLDFHHHVMNLTNEKEVPTVVHCSAGVGRTGTFIALDALCQAGQRTGQINVSEFVKNMRDQRVSMVQTSEQYITIYYALNEFFKAPFKRYNIPEFCTKFKKTTKERAANPHSLSEEFQLLLRCRPKYSEADYKMARYSTKADQTNIVLPLDKYSLHLCSFVKKRNTYINAITVPSFTNPRRFIVTQYPTPECAVDFLRLLNDHESDTVVCLDPVSKVESIRKWLPNLYSSNSVAPFNIYCQSTSSNDIISRVINIRMDGEESNIHTVSVIEPKCCIKPFETPLDTTELRDLVLNVLLSKTERPVTVVSRDGSSLCGVFIAVHNALQQLEMDGGVDVFTIVRQLQVRRPELCGNIEEYDMIHRALYDHIQVTSEDL
uniref:protein-tyrosine-phosphatase n=1 Tax=Crassostrea virginica TaxID=6565 RepID=A0A8B8C1A5_CRAVI|nr:receptor-type tyrosine-protein phosphatase T-like [Crassostrea virginica]